MRSGTYVWPREEKDVGLEVDIDVDVKLAECHPLSPLYLVGEIYLH